MGQDQHDVCIQDQRDVCATTIRSGPVRGHTPRVSRMKAVFVAIVLAVNLTAISLAVVAIHSKAGPDEQCQTARAKAARHVVAPLCVPCEEGWGKEEEEGWRRYRENGQDLCCPLHHRSLATAVDQIYDTVLQEQLQAFKKTPPKSSWSLQALYGEPENTGEEVLFANNNKPSAHVTGIQPYDASKFFIARPNGNVGDSLQTVSDWPLRFEPYRSAARGYVQRLTWGLAVPVSGLYRVHSTVNFHFTFPQHTKQLLQQRPQGSIAVVHQVTIYSRAEGSSTVLTQRNQTVSWRHMEGMTSFLVTVAELDVGDVVSVSLSHGAAMAMRDRWHSQGLFLMQ